MSKHPTQRRRLAYLAAPSSSPKSGVTQARIDEFAAFATHLEQGQECHVVSGMFNHMLCDRDPSLPRTWSFWQAQCEALMSVVDFAIVLKLEGWSISMGVQGEMDAAMRHNLPIVLVDRDHTGPLLPKISQEELLEFTNLHERSKDPLRFGQRFVVEKLAGRPIIFPALFHEKNYGIAIKHIQRHFLEE